VITDHRATDDRDVIIRVGSREKGKCDLCPYGVQYENAVCPYGVEDDKMKHTKMRHEDETRRQA
jgi:hypothetical protein